MPKVKLTDAAVQRYRAAAGERIEYFDRTLPGFALRVSGPTARNPGGHKSWVLYCRAGGKLQRLTIEPAYPALGLAEARRKAAAAMIAIQAGGNPVAEKRTKRAERLPDTIENVVHEFIKRHMLGQKRSPRYTAETKRNFANHVLPRWRGRHIKTVSRREVIELLDAIADAGTPIAANRTLAAIRKLFNWAIQRGIIEASPAGMIQRPGVEAKRERTLKPAEIRAVWLAAGNRPYPFGPYFQMVMATAQRRDEVARMRWADVDLAEQLWTIPSEMTKPGRAHAVPLSPLAVGILADCPRLGDHVFTTGRRRTPGAGDAPISGFSDGKERLDAAIVELELDEPIGPWTIHDLRRTAATMMAKVGVSGFTLARVLNHADSSVTGIYDRYEYLPEKRQALEQWAQLIENVIEPPDANIVPLRAESI